MQMTMWPITTVRIDRGIPSVWKSSSSEIPNTTYGITSGLSNSAETADLAGKRRRTSAIEASTPSTTAPTLESAAMTALVSRAPLRSEFERNARYQWNVNPLSGNDGISELLNEKMRRITIGAYRKTTTQAKKTLSARAPFFGSVTRRNAWRRLAPRSLAASSRLRSRLSSETKIGRATNGSQM